MRKQLQLFAVVIPVYWRVDFLPEIIKMLFHHSEPMDDQWVDIPRKVMEKSSAFRLQLMFSNHLLP